MVAFTRRCRYITWYDRYVTYELNDLDGKKVKENVMELISIKDEFDGLGDFFLTGGRIWFE